ncbi:NUDIX domain-containing protein [Parvibaculum sp.]|uniref:NUDIX domain-containing protein n=1 Tax=Parvibaculum sp. TaxID=2024848 RepID=UPI0032EEB56E
MSGGVQRKIFSERTTQNPTSASELANIPYTLIACVNQYDELLMVQRTKAPFEGCWNFIGGKIEAGESPSSAAIRELNEEAGRATTLRRRVQFRGIALWPIAGMQFHYLGMYLFLYRCKTNEAETRQLAMLDEGVTAWLHLDLLRDGSSLKLVPNFDLLLPYLLDSRKNPCIVCHEVTDTGVKLIWNAVIPNANRNIATSPHSSKFLNVDDLSGFHNAR